MNKRTILAIVAAVVFAFGFIFAATGAGVFLGLAAPEIRARQIATNESYATQPATVTRVIPSASTVNNQRLYRIGFRWNETHGESNAVYTWQQAEALVGSTITVRVGTNGRAVPVDFTPSVHSTIGWVFLPVFGGIGLLAIIAAVVVLFVRRNVRERSLSW